MRTRSTVIFLCLVACNGKDEGDDTDSPALPTCEPGQVRITGTIDGVPVDTTITETTHQFVNALGEEPGYLAITGPEGSLRLEFAELVANGDSTDARALAELSVGQYANCPGTAPSTITLGEDGESGTFVLRELHTGETCAGDPLAGELDGCWAYAP